MRMELMEKNGRGPLVGNRSKIRWQRYDNRNQPYITGDVSAGFAGTGVYSSPTILPGLRFCNRAQNIFENG